MTEEASTSEPLWLALRTVDALHAEQIRQHGGRDGLRDENLLQSALAAPRQRSSYGEGDVVLLAAIYAERIVRNHPYIDGNKRTAFLAAYTFLGLNGLTLEVDNDVVVTQTLALATGEIDADAYADWLRSSPAPTP